MDLKDYFDSVEISEGKPTLQVESDVVVLSDDESSTECQPFELGFQDVEEEVVVETEPADDSELPERTQPDYDSEYDGNLFLVEEACWDDSCSDSSLEVQPEPVVSDYEDTAFLVENSSDNSSYDSWENRPEPSASGIVVLSDEESADAFDLLNSDVAVQESKTEADVFEHQKNGTLETSSKFSSAGISNLFEEWQQKSGVTEVRRRKARPFKCPHCRRSYKVRRSLTKHLLSAHIGLDVGSDNSGANNPAKRPAVGTLYRCDECNFRTKRKSDIEMHMVAMHGWNKPHKCPECKYSSYESSSVKKHFLSIHMDYKPHKCPECSYKTARKVTLSNHINTVHRDYRPYQCPECDHRSNQKHSLKKHISAVHRKIKPFFCPECDYRGTRRSDVTRHVANIHRKYKPYQCTECDYSAGQKSSLNLHFSSVHLGYRPYQCPNCNYRTSRRSNLSIHVCPRSFLLSNPLSDELT